MNAKVLAIVILGTVGCRAAPVAGDLPVKHPAHPAAIQAAFDPGPNPFGVTATFPLPGAQRSMPGMHHADGTSEPDTRDDAAPLDHGPAPGTRYTCPMHPEVARSAPGPCPRCGMALRPVQEHSHQKGDSGR